MYWVAVTAGLALEDGDAPRGATQAAEHFEAKKMGERGTREGSGGRRGMPRLRRTGYGLADALHILARTTRREMTPSRHADETLPLRRGPRHPGGKPPGRASRGPMDAARPALARPEAARSRW